VIEIINVLKIYNSPRYSLLHKDNILLGNFGNVKIFGNDSNKKIAPTMELKAD
jgi:hypothetical protein